MTERSNNGGKPPTARPPPAFDPYPPSTYPPYEPSFFKRHKSLIIFMSTFALLHVAWFSLQRSTVPVDDRTELKVLNALFGRGDGTGDKDGAQGKGGRK